MFHFAENIDTPEELVMKFLMNKKDDDDSLENTVDKENSNEVQEENAVDDSMEHEFIKCLLDKVENVLISFIEKTLQEYNYKGSPIFDKYIDKETFSQIVDKVMKLSTEIPEIQEIFHEIETEPWDKKHLLKSLISTLVLILIGRTSQNQ